MQRSLLPTNASLPARAAHRRRRGPPPAFASAPLPPPPGRAAPAGVSPPPPPPLGRRVALLAAAALAAGPVLAPAPAAAYARGSVFATALQHLLRREQALESQLRALAEAAEAEVASAPRGGGAAGALCARPFGVDFVGITETVALVGATVGGLAARQRKRELEEVNEKLRAINISLRRQARAGVTYAPGLNYAPSAGGREAAAAAVAATEAAAAAAAAPAAASEARASLREGRQALKDSQPARALVHFRKALMLTRHSGERTLERRAVRGCGVAKRALGDRPGAIADLLTVLDISSAMGEHTGDTDALGAIADMYTEIGELEKAGLFYDRYIACLKGDLADAGAAQGRGAR